MENILDQAKLILMEYGLKIVGALVILIVGVWVSKKFKKISIRMLGKTKIDPTIINYIANIIYATLIVFVVIFSLQNLGVDTTSFMAVLGAAGLAIGLALKDSLSNFAAGVLLLIFRYFKTGDFIEAGGTSGVVYEISVFYTKLKSVDNKVIFVPNSALLSGNLVNYSAEDKRRVDLVFGIGYDDDIDKAKQVIWDELNKNDKVLKDPQPVVALIELADSSVNFNVRPWCKTSDYWAVYSELTEALKKRFDAEGINIPYPQTDVHLHQVQA
jgi:small conductance mechanosensitive channel